MIMGVWYEWVDLNWHDTHMRAELVAALAHSFMVRCKGHSGPPCDAYFVSFYYFIFLSSYFFFQTPFISVLKYFLISSSFLRQNIYYLFFHTPLVSHKPIEQSFMNASSVASYIYHCLIYFLSLLINSLQFKHN